MTRQFSAGGVVYKKVVDKGRVKTLWLVTKSRPSKQYPVSVWRLPKGWLDDEENGKSPGPKTLGKIRANEKDLQEAALREVKEEAGVLGKIICKLGSEKVFFRSKKDGKTILKFVTFYLMEWMSDLSPGFGPETEKVEWLEFDKALRKLAYEGEKKMLEKARVVIDAGA